MTLPIAQTGVQTALSVTTGAAVALTMPGTAGTRIQPSHCIIQVVGNSIRWTAFGTAPTSTIGVLVPAGANIEFMHGELNYANIISRFQAIGISGTATLNVAFFGGG